MNKYAVGEYERRFLLRRFPEGLSSSHTIIDRYIDGTRLRLRCVEDDSGAVIQQKLGHKRRLDAMDPTAIMHTSLYLDAAEYGLLSALPGHQLTKTRWPTTVQAYPAAVDAFADDLAGLIMLEVDCGRAEELSAFTPPAWAGPEVTHSETFTGAVLARLNADDLARAIRSVWGQPAS